MIYSIAAYQFIEFSEDQLVYWRDILKQKSRDYELKGTILLSLEGINLNLSGVAQQIKAMQGFLKNTPPFQNLDYRASWCQIQPYRRLLVRIKPEIITMGQPQLKPAQQAAPYVSPQTLCQWYANNKEMVVLDTRNEYECELGSFKNALTLNIKHFRHFPAAVEKLPKSIKNQTVVTFCTGGIRCEKAALYLQQQGFTQVYQLQGGILNYLTQCGTEHFMGDCFVFDNRVAINFAHTQIDEMKKFELIESL